MKEQNYVDLTFLDKLKCFIKSFINVLYKSFYFFQLIFGIIILFQYLFIPIFPVLLSTITLGKKDNLNVIENFKEQFHPDNWVKIGIGLLFIISYNIFKLLKKK